MIGDRALRMGAVLALVAVVAACAGAPDARRDGLVATQVAAGPAAVARGLTLPARIGLVRVRNGRITPVPGPERARWAGMVFQVNQRLLYPLRLVPLPPPQPATAAAVADAPAPGGGIESLLDGAARSGLDAVLFYELSVRVEGDRLAAALADLPVFGGVIPQTASTEGHGTALAVLVDSADGAVMGHTTARMNDRVLAGIRQSEGDAAAMAPAAAYALTHVLAPRVEDLLTGAATAAY